MKKLWIIISFLFSISLLQAQTEKLIAFWSFDDSTARDFSGNGFHGTIVNHPIPVPGIKGTAFQFKGKGYYSALSNLNLDELGDHILLPNIDFTKYPTFTISLWVMEQGHSWMHGAPYIWFGQHDKGWMGILNHIRYEYNPDLDTTLALHFALNAKDFAPSIWNYFDYSFRNQWIHYCMVYDNGFLSVYINGALQQTIKTNTAKLTPNASLGRHWWYYDGEFRTASRFTGIIDEVKIYNVALTKNEINKEITPDSSTCHPASFIYDNFVNPAGISKIGSVIKSDSVLRMTLSRPNEAGAMWREYPVPVKKGFTTKFSFSMQKGVNNFDDGSLPGADGFAFILQGQNPYERGNFGGGIGYEYIKNGLALEIDTYNNIEKTYNDPNGNHIALFSCLDSLKADHKTSALIFENNNIFTLRSDGTRYYCKISYFPQEALYIWLDSTEKFTVPVIQIPNFDITKHIKLINGSAVYAGISSATGTSFEIHDIHNWEFCSFPDVTFTDFGDKEPLIENNANCFPNPFSESVQVDFKVNNDSFINVKVIDQVGNIIDVLKTDVINGICSVRWCPKDISAGLYYISIVTDSQGQVKPVVYLGK